MKTFNSPFPTLMQREWMQHQRGWLVMLGLPLVLGVLAAAFGEIHFDSETAAGKMPGALALTLMTIGAIAAMTVAIAWVGTLLMSPGLARRDTQDRTIEFWLSLPTSHAQSLSATLLMHLLALPWAAIGVGLLSGLLVSPIIVGKIYGLGAWFGLPWGLLLLTCLAFALRLVGGVLLATLWLSPLILGTMAASAWLKRWGVPAIIAAAFASSLIAKVYGFTLLNDAVRYIAEEAGRALIATQRGPQPVIHLNHPDDLVDLLPDVAGWVMGDLGEAILSAATLGFVATVLVGAAAFGALILRRQRGA